MKYIRSLKISTQSARYFFSSQDFADGLRVTLAILIPAAIFVRLGQFETASMLSVGAIGVNLTDAPGPVHHKRNAMLLCNLLLFLVAIITGFARMNTFALGVEILCFSFLFSMFNVYGLRAASVGSAALLIMILMMGKPLEPVQVVRQSALILSGGLWYLLLSMTFSTFRPYRPAQRILGECIRETARFLRIKASFYQINTNLTTDYRKLVAQQIIVNEKQDAVREILFKTRLIMNDNSGTGRLLILAFVEVLDLFEHIMATYYDYSAVRARFRETGILEEISEAILQLAGELEKMGYAVQANLPYTYPANQDAALDLLKIKIDALCETDTNLNTLVLRKILVSIRDYYHRTMNLGGFFEATGTDIPEPVGEDPEHSRFVSRQVFDPEIFRDNLSFNSFVFRHAIRVMAACLSGFVIIHFIPGLQHGSWVLLTIIVIMKPRFSLTQQRNFQRLLGTLAGGVIGVLVLMLVKDKIAQFCLLLIFMLGEYSFQRRNYIVMVILMTPYILIMLNFLGVNFLDVAEERMIDTFIGSGIAFAASYLIFPSWESTQLRGYMQKVLKANSSYLQKLAESLAGEHISRVDYKLSRKDVFVHSANLSAAFQRMTSEPESKQRNKEEVHEFIVLNHILSSNISTIASGLMNNEPRIYPAVLRRKVNSSLAKLHKSLQQLGENLFDPVSKPEILKAEQPEGTEEIQEPLMDEQLIFIQELTESIYSITGNFLKAKK